jgi:hypothetical protein
MLIFQDLALEFTFGHFADLKIRTNMEMPIYMARHGGAEMTHAK